MSYTLDDKRVAVAQALYTTLLCYGWDQVANQRRFHLHEKKTPIGIDGNKLQSNGRPGEQWTLREAVNAFAGGMGDGLGVQLGECDGICLAGVDIDHCFANGSAMVADEWAVPLLAEALAAGYCERSPSGTGLHHIAMGHLPNGYLTGGKKGVRKKELGAERRGGIEVYEGGHYFTLTGWTGPQPLNGDTRAVASACAQFLTTAAAGGRSETQKAPERIAEGSRNDEMFRLASSLRAKGLTQEGIEAALQAENENRCDPPLDAEEVRNIARSAARYISGHSPEFDAEYRQRHLKEVFGGDGYSLFTGQSVRPYDFTDAGNAQAFARIFMGRVIYVNSIGWLIWDGIVWNANDKLAEKLAIQFTDQMLYEAKQELQNAGDAATFAAVENNAIASEAAKERGKLAEAYRAHAHKSRQASRITGLLLLAQSLMQVRPEELDAHPSLLNTINGVVNLADCTISPHDATLYCTKVTGCGISDDGTALFQNFLSTITQGDEALASFLQLVAGMAAVGQVFEENLITALGDGKNGKSAFFNALTLVFGSYAGTIAPEVLTTANRNKGAEMAMLKGKRLVIAAETEEGARLSPSVIKQLTSTDRIHAERKYKDPEDFIPSHTVVLYTNHLPRVGSTDEGIWRRLVVVPFPARISAVQEIKNFGDKLYCEAGGAMLSWVIMGAMRFIKAGHTLTRPAAVQQAIDQYREDNDWLGAFMAECCETGPGKQCPSSQLYGAYRVWAERTGEYTRHARDFKAEMEKRGFTWHKTKNANLCQGVALCVGIYSAGCANEFLHPNSAVEDGGR